MKYGLSIIVFFFAAQIFTSCSKGQLSKSAINGVWFIDSTQYNGSLSVPFLGGSNFTGVSINRGYFSFNRETAEVFYDLTFETDSLKLAGQALGPLEVKLKESGTYTEDESAIHILPSEGSAAFDITKTSSTASSGKWTTKAVTKTKISIPFLGALEVPANFNLTLSSKKSKP
jgi:hypothetical protein